MNKEIETIKTEIDTISKGIETYHDMVSDKLTSLAKRLDDLTKKEKPTNEITQSDWMWIPGDNDYWYYISDTILVMTDKGSQYNSGFQYKYRMYNVFKTKELAESRRHLSPLQRKWAFILDYLGRDESKIMTNDNDYKYFPRYHIKSHEVLITSDSAMIHKHPSQYAVSIKMCEQAIEIMRDDIYSYLGIDKP